MQVAADESLAHALQVHPLQLTLYKQGTITNSRGIGKTSVTTVAAAVPIGSADVDLSPLLVTRYTIPALGMRFATGAAIVYSIGLSSVS